MTTRWQYTFYHRYIMSTTTLDSECRYLVVIIWEKKCPKRNQDNTHNSCTQCIIDEFPSLPRVFFVTNKINHGSLQEAVKTEGS